ncbi:MAG: polyribonucleotide nucleotidyltransferase [Rhodospirillaceae bacterium]|jgi:polyribonucleotide nucleotidyltransferase|nr:polyribonucleotide nucleotidyltransferase [Rhodospirillaceae bacterium]MBT5082042.1 polyribonucleotide nucleotidyltransferase [Rhodospirillaceae bacterium]MBT5524750.1 polyribonucleotide nucleotidyltransferase [Rhodospirillaceae bacterium]MBT5881209.1 polyribonucleotide nucleotidyltransferase [Rhodospirillaceae bacterium]MBT6912154.1 polyribonucleotide nucleotidyltransferase [Rhodospirillaceae bacterium]
MFDIHRKEIMWGGRKLVLETGHIARQADGAVMVTYDETSVLCAVTAAREARAGIDFFPLTVNYVEKTYAAGKIPGGFFKREARPSENEILTCRLIDRPIRPLFVDGFRNETQIICTTMSHDLENSPDIAALVGTSAALTISGMPFMGPIAAARVGYINGEYVLNPRIDELADSDLDMVVAGTADAVMMVESEANQLSEDVMLGAVMFAHKEMQPVIQAIIDLAEVAAKEPWDMAPPEDHSGIEARVADAIADDLKAAYAEPIKQTRTNMLSEAKAKAYAALAEDPDAGNIGGAFKTLEKNLVRGQILDSGKRIDGRDTRTVRQIECQVGVLPRTHGAALFTRGETQALVVTTLGTGDDEQIMDALAGSYRQHFMLHYNFPPYSVGEAGRFGFTSRREIGHGKLAWRAMNAVMPEKDDFPYTIRIVSEITESNGSSSMASVCGSSLSLMDAGVPLKAAVAGIAMGLILEGDRHAILSDILGDEDHLGDMDFKVAGTENGVTSLQMDIKIAGITEAIMRDALAQANEGRKHILGEMQQSLGEHRGELRESAPKIHQMKVPTDKIREIIGTGGKVIRAITEETGAKIDISDDGSVRVSSPDQESIDAATAWITGIIAEPEIGMIYKGKVVKVVDFGAFVNFMGARDGLCHISELAPHRVKTVNDICNEGDTVYVKCLAIDDRGKVRLSMKMVDQATGKEIVQEEATGD